MILAYYVRHDMYIMYYVQLGFLLYEIKSIDPVIYIYIVAILFLQFLFDPYIEVCIDSIMMIDEKIAPSAYGI